MLHDPLLLLSANASFQVLASCLLGAFMLVPMQPWAKGLKARMNMKALLAAHLDWLMLAFMQWGAVLVMTHWPSASSPLTSWLLVFGGWMNAAPYLFRAFGIDGFAFAGDWKQRAASSLGGISSLGILVAWARVVCSLLSTMGRALFLGPLVSVPPHTAAVDAVLVGLDVPFEVIVGSDIRTCEAAVVPARTEHALEFHGGRVAVLYVEPGCQVSLELDAPALRRSVEAALDHDDLSTWLQLLADAHIEVATGPVDERVARVATLLSEAPDETISAVALAAQDFRCLASSTSSRRSSVFHFAPIVAGTGYDWLRNTCSPAPRSPSGARRRVLRFGALQPCVSPDVRAETIVDIPSGPARSHRAGSVHVGVRLARKSRRSVSRFGSQRRLGWILVRPHVCGDVGRFDDGMAAASSLMEVRSVRGRGSRATVTRTTTRGARRREVAAAVACCRLSDNHLRPAAIENAVAEPTGCVHLRDDICARDSARTVDAALDVAEVVVGVGQTDRARRADRAERGVTRSPTASLMRLAWSRTWAEG